MTPARCVQDQDDARLRDVADDKRIALGPAGRLVAENIRRYRGKLTFAELSARLEEIGRPIPVLGLRRIEKGDRRVDVDDLLAIARALDVPPALLVYPLGVAGTVEVLPGEMHATWDAVKWFGGRAAFPGDPRSVEWAPVPLHEDHDRLVDDWQWEQARLTEAERALSTAKSEEARAARRDRVADILGLIAERERDLAELRQGMRTRYQGVPPALPEELAAAIGEPAFVVYERADGSGRIRERRTVVAGSHDDHQLAQQRPKWAWVDLPFKEPPADFNLDEPETGRRVRDQED